MRDPLPKTKRTGAQVSRSFLASVARSDAELLFEPRIRRTRRREALPVSCLVKSGRARVGAGATHVERRAILPRACTSQLVVLEAETGGNSGGRHVAMRGVRARESA
jgi:hypothetical protein